MATTKVCGCLNQSAPSVLCSHRRNHLHMVSFCHSMLHFECIVNDTLQLCWPFVHCGVVWCRWKQTHHFPYVMRSLFWPLCTHILLPPFCHNMGDLSMCVTGAYKCIMCTLARLLRCRVICKYQPVCLRLSKLINWLECNVTHLSIEHTYIWIWLQYLQCGVHVICL